MAIFHFAVASVSRAAGHSSVREGAYISGACFLDERTGLVENFSHKAARMRRVAIIGWPTANAVALWNAAERAEKRRDAKVARTIIVALPAELSGPQQWRLACDFAHWLHERHGCAVHLAQHAPPNDPRNHHAHFLLTTRVVDEGNRLGAKTRELDRRYTSNAHIKAWRCTWQDAANLALAEAESAARIDCRSHREAGRAAIAKKHLGARDTALVRKGRQPAAHVWNLAVDELRVVIAEIEWLENDESPCIQASTVSVAPMLPAQPVTRVIRRASKASKRRSAVSRARRADLHRSRHQRT